MSEEDRIIATVISLELRLLDPGIRASSREVERLLRADFREIGSSGRAWDRDSVLAALKTAPGESTAVSDMSARIVADGVVLVTYLARREGAVPHESLRSSLWCEDDDGWRVLFHQGTPVGPAEPDQDRGMT